MLALIGVVSGSVSASGQTPAPAWRGTLQDEAAHPILQAKVELDADDEHKTTTTTSDGAFVFDTLLPKTYSLSVEVNGRVYRSSAAIIIPAQAAGVILTLRANGTLVVGIQQEKAAAGGEKLTSKAVSEIPLNKRDFSQLLLLAAGTAADSSGASNFTQQFAIMDSVA